MGMRMYQFDWVHRSIVRSSWSSGGRGGASLASLGLKRLALVFSVTPRIADAASSV